MLVVICCHLLKSICRRAVGAGIDRMNGCHNFFHVQKIELLWGGGAIGSPLCVPIQIR
jgi:hypothetical protein